MQQPDQPPSHESIIVVHTSRSWTEAVVVRGLLESAGIEAAELGAGTLSPMPDLAPVLYGIDIYVLESQAARAREIIAAYLAELEEDADPGE